MNSTTETLAKALLDAASSGIACAPIRDQIETIRSARKPMPSAVEVAYEVQCHNTAIAQASGRRVVGRKIGLTSLAVQKQLGVDQPDFGTLFADMARLEGLPIPWHHTMQPKVEAEVALVLKDDLLFDRHTVADIINATAYALPTIEIVGSRISNWDIRLVDTVADNASSGLFVLGSKPVQLGLLDLLNCAMRMTRDDEVVSEGHGAACLGNPLNAAVWLADTMVRFKTPLRAGQVILTGALGPMAIVKAGQTFTAHIDGLGTVSAVFGAEESKVAE